MAPLMQSTAGMRLQTATMLLVGALGCGATVTPATSDVPPTSDLQATDAPALDDAPARPDIAVDDAPLRVPRRHRAARETCPAERPPSSCEPPISGPPSMCRADDECTSGVNGRCVGNPHDGCRCNYDACRDDSMCAAGGPCACRHLTRGASGANICLPGNCQIDADCGAGGYCSPTFGSCGDYSGVVGYRCHTPRDECVDDEDCRDVDAGFLGQRGYCMFAPEVGHWRCSNSACAG